MKTIDINGQGPIYLAGTVTEPLSGHARLPVANMMEALGSALRYRAHLDAAIENMKRQLRDADALAPESAREYAARLLTEADAPSDMALRALAEGKLVRAGVPASDVFVGEDAKVEPAEEVGGHWVQVKLHVGP